MWMTYLGDDVRVPPPFNLLPTPSALRRLHGVLAKCPRLSGSTVEEFNASRDDETSEGKESLASIVRGIQREKV